MAASETDASTSDSEPTDDRGSNPTITSVSEKPATLVSSLISTGWSLCKYLDSQRPSREAFYEASKRGFERFKTFSTEYSTPVVREGLTSTTKYLLDYLERDQTITSETREKIESNVKSFTESSVFPWMVMGGTGLFAWKYGFSMTRKAVASLLPNL